MQLFCQYKSEERLFKNAESAAKCIDRKAENKLPRILKHLQLKRENVRSNQAAKQEK